MRKDLLKSQLIARRRWSKPKAVPAKSIVRLTNICSSDSGDKESSVVDIFTRKESLIREL